MSIKLSFQILLILALLNAGCTNALWFGAGAATGAVVHEAVDDDEKVIVVEKEAR